MKILIVCGSITHAIHAKNLLEMRDVRSYVQKAPAGLYSYGCNYAVKVICDKSEPVISLLRMAGIKIGAAYVENGEGKFEPLEENGHEVL